MNDLALQELFKAEAAIFKRDFTAEQRRKLAKEGKALPSGAYPIETSADLHPAAVLARSGHGDVAAAKALIARRAKELGAPNPLDDDKESKIEKAEFSFESPVELWKDDAKQITYGIVLHPDTVDSQGDIVSKAEIEQAAHRYLAESRRADIQHSETPADIEVVESYVAPQDMTIAGQPVLKGSWVMAHHVKDAEVWKGITEGKLTGLSIGGSGVRVPGAS